MPSPELSIEQILEELGILEQMCNVSLFPFVNRCLNQYGKKGHIIQMDTTFCIFRIIPKDGNDATN